MFRLFLEFELEPSCVVLGRRNVRLGGRSLGFPPFGSIIKPAPDIFKAKQPVFWSMMAIKVKVRINNPNLTTFGYTVEYIL